MTITVSALCACRDKSDAQQQEQAQSEKPWVVDRFDDIKDYWYKDVESFKKLSRKYYLYK